MLVSEPLKPAGAFQYRLRFFHKCRSPGACDPGQLDRYQIQGSTLESTCGAPLIVVLVRYWHDPQSGLSKECQRAQFPQGRSPFAVKAIVVPEDRVLEYMDQPLLQQPRLVDAQGRHLIGGPDVSPDGEIYATTLQSNGIAHLNNFGMMVPTNEIACNRHQQHQQQQQQDGDNRTGKAGPREESDAAADPRLSGGNRLVNGSSDGRSQSSELCLVVQLLRRDGQQPGKWYSYSYDIPHLVSRPFQVISRTTWLAMQHHLQPPLLASPPDLGPHQGLVPSPFVRPGPTMPLQRPHAHSMGGGFGPRPSLADNTSTAGHVLTGRGTGRTLGLSAGGAETGVGFVLGSAAGGGPTMGSGTGKSCGAGGGAHRRSGSGGSPRGQRVQRGRRRGCQSKDASHDDDGLAPVSALSPGSMSAGDGTVTGPLIPALVTAKAGDVRSQATTPCSMSPTVAAAATAFAASAVDALAESAAAGELDGEGLGDVGGGGGGRALGLAQASSAMLLDMKVADLVNGVAEAKPFFAQDATTREGMPKRAKSTSSAPCPPGNPIASSQPNATGRMVVAQQHPQRQVQQQQPQEQLFDNKGPLCGSAVDGAMVSGLLPCGAPPPFLYHPSGCNGWSCLMPPATATAVEQLTLLRKKPAILSGNTAAAPTFAAGAAADRSLLTSPLDGGQHPLAPSTHLEELMGLLGEPGVMQGWMDCMDEQQQQQQHVTLPQPAQQPLRRQPVHQLQQQAM